MSLKKDSNWTTAIGLAGAATIGLGVAYLYYTATKRKAMAIAPSPSPSPSHSFHETSNKSSSSTTSLSRSKSSSQLEVEQHPPKQRKSIPKDLQEPTSFANLQSISVSHMSLDWVVDFEQTKIVGSVVLTCEKRYVRMYIVKAYLMSMDPTSFPSTSNTTYITNTTLQTLITLH